MCFDTHRQHARSMTRIVIAWEVEFAGCSMAQLLDGGFDPSFQLQTQTRLTPSISGNACVNSIRSQIQPQHWEEDFPFLLAMSRRFNSNIDRRQPWSNEKLHTSTNHQNRFKAFLETTLPKVCEEEGRVESRTAGVLILGGPKGGRGVGHMTRSPKIR